MEDGEIQIILPAPSELRRSSFPLRNPRSQAFIVPFTIQEWERVVKLWSSQKPDEIVECVDILTAWKCRMGRQIPVALAVTEEVLRAVAVDDADRDALTVKLVLSSAVIRFVNYVNEVLQNKNGDLRSIAPTVEQVGIPFWVVSVRHRATHDQMPTLSELRRANEFCRQWLWDNYWSKPCAEAMQLVMGRGARTRLEPVQTQGEPDEDDRLPIMRLTDFVNWRNHNSRVEKRTYGELSSLSWFDGIEELLELRASDLFDVLLMEGMLVLPEHELKRQGFTIDIGGVWTVPMTLEKFWQPLLMMMREKRVLYLLTIMCLEEINANKDLSPSTRAQLLGWSTKFLDEFAGYGQPTALSASEWSLLLTAVISMENQLDKDLVKRVVKNAGVTNTRKRQLHRLLDVSMNESVFKARDSMSVMTLDQLRKELFKDAKAAETQEAAKTWRLDRENNWQGVALGLTPHQTVESLLLTLNMEEVQASEETPKEHEKIKKKKTKKTAAYNLERVMEEAEEIIDY